MMGFSEFFRLRWHWLFVMLLAAFIIFSPFLAGRQRVHDSHLIEIMGYQFLTHGIADTAVDSLVAQGRPISSLYYRILYVIDPPHTLVMSMSVAASLLFLALAAFVLLYMLDKYVNIGALAVLGAFALFFNPFILDSMMFYENSVMNMGALFAVLAVAAYFGRGVVKKALSMLFLLIAVFSYQAAAAYFMPLLVLCAAVRHNFDIKATAKDVLLGGLLYAAALLANYGFIWLVGSDDLRVAGDIDLAGNISGMMGYGMSVLASALGFTRPFRFFAGLVMLFVMLVISTRAALRELAVYAAAIFMLGFAAMINHLPMSLFYVMPRSAVAFGGVGGLIILCMAVADNAPIRSIKGVAAAAFIAFIAANQVAIQQASFANDRMDYHEVAQIAARIVEHETQNSVEINTLHTIMAHPRTLQRPYIRNFHDVTIRALSIPWLVRPMLERQLGRAFAPNWDVSFAQYQEHELRYREIVAYHHRMLFVDDRLYLVID